MWKHTLVAFITFAALTAGAQARSSSNRDVAAATIGGLITGVVLSELIDDGNVSVHFANRRGDGWDRYHSDFRDYDRRYDRRYDRYDRGGRYHDRGGSYVWEKRRVWVPGFWEFTRDNCGRKMKIWVKGHYETRRVKVWVNNRHSKHYYRPDPYCR